MAVEDLKALTARYYDEVWEKGNLEAATQLVASDIVDHMAMPGQAQGIDGHNETVSMVHHAFPDATFAIEDVVAEGDRVVGRWTMRATHRGEIMGVPATGRPVTMTGMDIMRWADGKLVEIWHQEDIMGMLQQLGALPGPGGAGR